MGNNKQDVLVKKAYDIHYTIYKDNFTAKVNPLLSAIYLNDRPSIRKIKDKSFKIRPEKANDDKQAISGALSAKAAMPAAFFSIPLLLRTLF